MEFLKPRYISTSDAVVVLVSPSKDFAGYMDTIVSTTYDLFNRKLFSLPKIERLMPLLKGGAALQLRNFALNLTFLAVTRVTQSIDDTGVAAAAHAMSIQTFQIGGIVLLALSNISQST